MPEIDGSAGDGSPTVLRGLRHGLRRGHLGKPAVRAPGLPVPLPGPGAGPRDDPDRQTAVGSVQPVLDAFGVRPGPQPHREHRHSA